MATIKEVTKAEQSAARLTISLSKDEVKSSYDAYIKDILKDLQLPGFRRGRVPREVLERKAGSTLKDDALARLIGETSKSIFAKEDFPKEFIPLPFSDPELQGETKLDLESELEFTLLYDVKPEVKIDKWEGLTIEIDDAAIADDDVKRELEVIRDLNAVVLDRNEGEKSQKTDVVTVDFAEIGEDGAVIPATKREDYVFELGSKRNYYQFDDEIIGMKAGEERNVEKSYPAEFENKDLADKTKKLRVWMKVVKKKELPALDDDLAQDIDEKFKTFGDLKKDVRSKLEKRLKERLNALKNDAIIKKIIENSSVELPKTMIEYESAERIYGMTGRLPEGGFRQIVAENAGFAEVMRPQVETTLRGRLIIEKLFEDNKIEVSDDDIEAEFKSYAEESGEDIEKVKEYFAAGSEAFEDTKRTLRERKLFELIASKNTIKKGKKARYVDLFPPNA